MRSADRVLDVLRRGHQQFFTVERPDQSVLGHDEVAIRVADRGPGISERQLGELFKPFFTTKPEGHGLGLAISQNIQLEHGGRIVAQNRPPHEGTGAAFEVQLPIVR